MKTGHFEMVVVLLAPMILMDILQVMLGMGSMWSLERDDTHDTHFFILGKSGIMIVRK